VRLTDHARANGLFEPALGASVFASNPFSSPVAIVPDEARELRVAYTVLRFSPDSSVSDRRRTIAAREAFDQGKRPAASKRLNPHAGRGGLSNVILVSRYTISDLGVSE
jgi:hypothetical protein